MIQTRYDVGIASLPELTNDDSHSQLPPGDYWLQQSKMSLEIYRKSTLKFS